MVIAAHSLDLVVLPHMFPHLHQLGVLSRSLVTSVGTGSFVNNRTNKGNGISNQSYIFVTSSPRANCPKQDIVSKQNIMLTSERERETERTCTVTEVVVFAGHQCGSVNYWERDRDRENLHNDRSSCIFRPTVWQAPQTSCSRRWRTADWQGGCPRTGRRHPCRTHRPHPPRRSLWVHPPREAPWPWLYMTRPLGSPRDTSSERWDACVVNWSGGGGG